MFACFYYLLFPLLFHYCVLPVAGTAASVGPANSGWHLYGPDSPCSCSEMFLPGSTALSHLHPPGNIWIQMYTVTFDVQRYLAGVLLYVCLKTIWGYPKSSCISVTMSSKICRRCHFIWLHSLWKSKAMYLKYNDLNQIWCEVNMRHYNITQTHLRGTGQDCW